MRGVSGYGHERHWSSADRKQLCPGCVIVLQVCSTVLLLCFPCGDVSKKISTRFGFHVEKIVYPYYNMLLGRERDDGDDVQTDL